MWSSQPTNYNWFANCRNLRTNINGSTNCIYCMFPQEKKKCFFVFVPQHFEQRASVFHSARNQTMMLPDRKTVYFNNILHQIKFQNYPLPWKLFRNRCLEDDGFQVRTLTHLRNVIYKGLNTEDELRTIPELNSINRFVGTHVKRSHSKQCWWARF